jgi:MtN3 and saliva related transmembrane protein
MYLITQIIAYQEFLGYTAAALSAGSFLPQVVRIWQFRSVKDISSAMYIIYGTSVILWLIYGLVIESMPLILAETITLILVATILYMKYLWK